MKRFVAASVLAAMAFALHEAATARPVYDVGPAARSVSVGTHLADTAVRAREKSHLQTLRPGPDRDPRTIEGIAQNGSEVLIFVQTSDPELFRGMTPAEFADTAYP